jgi:hypothetical protein
MRSRFARRYWQRIDHVGEGLPWSSPLGIAVAYLVIRQVLMMWLAMFVGGPGWHEFWTMNAGLGMPLPAWFVILNALVTAFVVVDFWRYLVHTRRQGRALFLAYVTALLVLGGMQHAVW